MHHDKPNPKEWVLEIMHARTPESVKETILSSTKSLHHTTKDLLAIIVITVQCCVNVLMELAITRLLARLTSSHRKVEKL